MKKKLIKGIMWLGIAGFIYSNQQVFTDASMNFIKDCQQNMVDKYVEPCTDAVLTAFPK